MEITCEYAKQFKSSTFDFILNWYPGKQNSILLHGKHGELFKAVLLTVLREIVKGGLQEYKIFVVTTTATSKICSQLQLLLLLNKSSSLLTTATA